MTILTLHDYVIAFCKLFMVFVASGFAIVGGIILGCF